MSQTPTAPAVSWAFLCPKTGCALEVSCRFDFPLAAYVFRHGDALFVPAMVGRRRGRSELDLMLDWLRDLHPDPSPSSAILTRSTSVTTRIADAFFWTCVMLAVLTLIGAFIGSLPGSAVLGVLFLVLASLAHALTWPFTRK